MDFFFNQLFTMTKSELNCEICNTAPDKYKCPTCRLRYCSVACCRVHKQSGECHRPAEIVKVIDTTPALSNEHKLKLVKNKELIQTLRSNPELLLTLKGASDSDSGSTDKVSWYHNAIQNDTLFIQFVAECMK